MPLDGTPLHVQLSGLLRVLGLPSRCGGGRLPGSACPSFSRALALGGLLQCFPPLLSSGGSRSRRPAVLSAVHLHQDAQLSQAQ